MTDLAALDTWLAEARAVLDMLNTADPRYARGAALVAKRQAERDALAWPVARHAFAVRWGREKGWLEVRDIHTGLWFGAMAYTAPLSWGRDATKTARAQRQGRTG